jgi:membrane protease YdiL (CAAX protease family)
MEPLETAPAPEVTASTEPAGQKGLVRRIFVADGRPALPWRVLGFFVAYFAWQVILGLACYAISRGVYRTIVYDVVRCAGTVGLVALFRRRVDKRPWRAMKLDPLRGRLLGLLAGWLAGAAMVVVLFAIELAAGWIHVVGYEHTTGGMGPTAVYLLVGLIAGASTGLCEETATRGYLFQNLGEHMPIGRAATHRHHDGGRAPRRFLILPGARALREVGSSEQPRPRIDAEPLFPPYTRTAPP